MICASFAHAFFVCSYMVVLCVFYHAAAAILLPHLCHAALLLL